MVPSRCTSHKVKRRSRSRPRRMISKQNNGNRTRTCWGCRWNRSSISMATLCRMPCEDGGHIFPQAGGRRRCHRIWPSSFQQFEAMLGPEACGTMLPMCTPCNIKTQKRREPWCMMTHVALIIKARGDSHDVAKCLRCQTSGLLQSNILQRSLCS